MESKERTVFQEHRFSEGVVEFRVHTALSIRNEIIYTSICLPWVVFRYLGLLPNLFSGYKVQWLLVTAIVMIWMLKLATIESESVLVVKDFGIQISQKNYYGTETKRFFDREKILKLFVHEYISRATIKVCLAFQIQGDSKLQLCYQEVYPGLPALQKVYSVCYNEIWKGKGHSSLG